MNESPSHSGSDSAATRRPPGLTSEEAVRWLAELFNEAPEALKAETPRSAIASWDSLGVLTLIADLDEKFGIVLADGEVQRLATIGDILTVLRTHGRLSN